MTEPRPVRLQLSRKKGFDLQAWSREVNGLPAVKVDRASGFGNPFPIFKGTSTHLGVTTDCWEVGTWNGPGLWFRDSKAEAIDLAVKAFRAWAQSPSQTQLLELARRKLRGKNLACWCRLCAKHAATGKPLDEPCPDCARCHVDPLGALANTPICEAIP